MRKNLQYNPSIFERVEITDLNQLAQEKGLPAYLAEASAPIIPHELWDPRSRPFKEWTRHLVAQSVKTKPQKKSLFVLPSYSGRDIQILKQYEVAAPGCRWVWAEQDKDIAEYFASRCGPLIGSDNSYAWARPLHLLPATESFDFAWFDLYGNLTWDIQDYLINNFEFAGNPTDADVFFTFAGHGAWRGGSFGSTTTLLKLIIYSMSDESLTHKFKIDNKVNREYGLLQNQTPTESQACNRPNYPQAITRSCKLDDVVVGQMQVLKYIFNSRKGYDFDCDAFIYNDATGRGSYDQSMVTYHLHNFKKTSQNYFGRQFTEVMSRLYYRRQLDDDSLAADINLFIDNTYEQKVNFGATEISRWRNLVHIPNSSKIKPFNLGIQLENNLYNTLDVWPEGIAGDSTEDVSTLLPQYMPELLRLLKQRLLAFLPLPELTQIEVTRSSLLIRSPKGEYLLMVGAQTLYINSQQIQIIPVFLHSDNTEPLNCIFRRLFISDPYLHPRLCGDLTSAELRGKHPCTEKFSLPQEAAYIEWLESWNRCDREGTPKETAGLIVLPTGLGKTWVAAEAAKTVLLGRNGINLGDQIRRSTHRTPRVLFIGGQAEILDQAIRTFIRRKVVLPENIGVFYETYNKDIRKLRKPKKVNNLIGPQVVFATPQSMQDQLVTLAQTPDYFSLVIIDEAHHAAADTWRALVSTLSRCEYLLGFTATPFRLDQKHLSPIFKSNGLYELTLSRGVYMGYLVDTAYSVYSPKRVSSEEELSKTYNISSKELLNSPDVILEKLQNHLLKDGSMLKTVVFCQEVKEAEQWAELIQNALQPRVRTAVTAKVLWHETKDRQEILTAFEQGRIQILCVKDLLNEGVDIPSIEAVVFLRKTESKAKVLQQMGRGMRLYPGKLKLVVVDFTSNYSDVQELLGLASLIGLDFDGYTEGPGGGEAPEPREPLLGEIELDREMQIYLQNEFQKEKERGIVEKVMRFRMEGRPKEEIRRAAGNMPINQFEKIFGEKVPDKIIAERGAETWARTALQPIWVLMNNAAFYGSPGKRAVTAAPKSLVRIMAQRIIISDAIFETVWECFEKNMSFEQFVKTMIERHSKEIQEGRRRLRRHNKRRN